METIRLHLKLLRTIPDRHMHGGFIMDMYWISIGSTEQEKYEF